MGDFRKLVANKKVDPDSDEKDEFNDIHLPPQTLIVATKHAQ